MVTQLHVVSILPLYIIGTLAHILLVSTRSTDISCPVLYMLDRAGSTVVLETPLETCASSMSANITMPAPGNYYYKLGGEDTAGNSFNYLIQRKITVPSGDNFYSLTSVGSYSIAVVAGQVAIIRFQFSSTNPYGSVAFNFTLAEKTLQHQVSPSQYVMTYGGTVNVAVHVRPTAISQQVTLTVSNKCTTISAKKTITVVQPVSI